MKSRREVAVVVSTVLLSLIVAQTMIACPVCYGAADSPMTDGMNVAILSLLGITGGVLAGFIAFFVYLRKRAKMLQRRFADMLN